jgi:hypothetical protein
MHIHDVHSGMRDEFSQGPDGGDQQRRLATGCELYVFTAIAEYAFCKPSAGRSDNRTVTGLHDSSADIHHTPLRPATVECRDQLQNGERTHAGDLSGQKTIAGAFDSGDT